LKTIRYITIIFLSLMICFTSSGINLFFHVCNGHFNKLSFTKTDAACGIETTCKHQYNSSSTILKNKNTCCQNHSILCQNEVRDFKNFDTDLSIKNTDYPLKHLLHSIDNFYYLRIYHSVKKSLDLYSIHSFYSKKRIFLILQNFRN
jgi:hypothetical protein